MGQISTVDRLPSALRDKVFKMLDNPSLTQAEIAEAINTEVGKRLLSRSSMCRFVASHEKTTGTKRRKKAPSFEESLARIATALERIATSLER
jgi:hypothetical protein